MTEQLGAVDAPEERVAVVVNGNAKGVTKDLVDILDQIVRTGDLFVSRSLQEGREIAETIVRRGYRTVLTGGGDGTFAQVVSWVRQEATRAGRPEPRFGLLRLGTGNALAWVLGSENQRGRGVVPDLARLRQAGSRPLRLLEVDGRLTPFAGLGVDAVALHNYEEMKDRLRKVPVVRALSKGGAAHLLSVLGRTIPEYLVRPHHHVRVVNTGAPAVRLGVDGQPVGGEIATGEVLYEGPARMVAMSTIPYWGFGARIFPFADEREDRYSLRVVDISVYDVVTKIHRIWDGSYRDDRIHDFLVERAKVHTERPVPFQIGGDSAGLRSVTEVALAAKPVEVIDYYVPPSLAVDD